MPADSPELKLARLLAKPFVQRSTDDRPLSFRCLPEGGMVVISADGRKLWFTLDEVNQARTELGIKPIAATVSSAPPGGSRDGQSEMIVLPPDLKHLEELIHDKHRHH